MDSDQDQHSVRPDLGSNWLQRLPADDKSSTHRAPLKILIRLCGGAGWSESSTGAHDNLYLLMDTTCDFQQCGI